jgi:hypothetical protein
MNHLTSKAAAAFLNGVVALLFGLAVFAGLPAAAQDRDPAQDTNKAIHLPPAQLKAFEGHFQFSQSTDQVMEFKVINDTLVAKLLWNGLMIHCVPESDSVFHNVELVEGRIVPLRFTRNGDGKFVQMFLADQQRPWVRIVNYKPLVRTEIAHTPEQLKAFEGTYQGQDKQSFIGITEKNNKLVLRQYWDGSEIEFLPDSALHFFSPEQQRFTLQFVKKDDGSIVRMIAFGRDRWDKTKAYSLTPADVKSFEGKYRLSEDPDDVVQMTASGLDLVIKQLWDGKETVVSPKTNVFFYNQQVGYMVTFDKDNGGVVMGAFLLGGRDYFEKIRN